MGMPPPSDFAMVIRSGEVFGSEPFAGARKARLDFVGDEEDAVLTANGLEKLEVVAWRNDEAAFAENGFDDHGGD